MMRPYGPPPIPLANAVPAHSTAPRLDRKSTRLNSSHSQISYAVFCLKKKKKSQHNTHHLEHETDARYRNLYQQNDSPRLGVASLTTTADVRLRRIRRDNV